MARRQRPRRSRLGIVSLLLVLAGLGLAQYADEGRLRWPDDLGALVSTLLDGLAAPTPATSSEPPLQGLAVNITDGDTFTLRYGSTEEERVRLHGIDAPERDQPHGRAAGQALASLIENRRVRVELVERDQYGRLVARVWLEDRDINLALVAAGHAWWYEQYARDDRALSQAQADARSAGLGLWSQPDQVAPWDWRRGRR